MIQMMHFVEMTRTNGSQVPPAALAGGLGFARWCRGAHRRLSYRALEVWKVTVSEMAIYGCTLNIRSTKTFNVTFQHFRRLSTSFFRRSPTSEPFPALRARLQDDFREARTQRGGNAVRILMGKTSCGQEDFTRFLEVLKGTKGTKGAQAKLKPMICLFHEFSAGCWKLRPCRLTQTLASGPRGALRSRAQNLTAELERSAHDKEPEMVRKSTS